MMHHQSQNHETNAIPCLGDAADLLLNAISEHQSESHESLLSSDITLVMSTYSMPTIDEECSKVIGVEDPLRRDPAIQDRLGELILSRGGQWIKMSAKFKRWGIESMTIDGDINERGWKSIAKAVLKATSRLQSVKQIGSTTRGVDEDVVLAGWPQGDLAQANFTLAANKLIGLPAVNPIDAAAILENQLIIPSTSSWEPITFLSKVDWSTKGPDRSWQSCFLALDFLHTPLKAIASWLGEHKEDLTAPNLPSRDLIERLVHKVTDIAIDFIDSNPPGASLSARCWHEGTATKRMLALVGTLTMLYAQPFIERRKVLADIVKIHDSIQKHAALIIDPRQYIQTGNHGLRQDVYLYTAGSIINRVTGNCTWADLAKQRIRTSQIARGIGPDGAWCEHSAVYHIFVMTLLSKNLQDARAMSDDEHSQFLVGVLEKMLAHLRLILNDNFRLPWIGDTGVDKSSYQAFMATTKRNISPPTAGVDHSSAGETESLTSVGTHYLRSGFDRSGWFRARGKNDFGVLFHAQLNSAKHKHADDLSFVVQRSGIDWIVDPGALNKEVGNQMRDHFRLDASAHNTYTVNGLSYPFKKMKRRTELDRHFEGEGWSAASGINERYADGLVRRTMLVLHDVGSIVIIDSLLARKQPCDWTSHLHFGLEIMAKKTGDQSIVATASSGETMHIDYHGTPANLSIISGQQDPPLGWLETGWSKAAPAPVAVNELHGDKVVSAMHITFGDSPCPADIVILGDKATVTLEPASGTTSHWTIEAQTGDVTFSKLQNSHD